MKRRLVGIAVLSLVILIVAWWLPDRDDGQKRLNPERLPTETRVYDIHALKQEPPAVESEAPPEAEAESPPNIDPGFGQLAGDDEGTPKPTSSASSTPAFEDIEDGNGRQAAPKPSSSSTTTGLNSAEPAVKPAPKPTPKPAPKPVESNKVSEPAPTPSKATQSAKPSTALPSGGWVVQVGSYGNQANADTMRKKLEAKGYRVMVTSGQVNGKTFHRVRVGPYSKKTDASGAASNLEKLLGQKVAVLSNN